MDIQPDSQTTRTISDDQELAKVLAGVGQDGADTSTPGDEPEEMALPTPPAPAPTEQPIADPVAVPDPIAPEPVMPPMPDPISMPSSPASDTGLETIKQQALGELRPLVDKLNVSPEEKFDTYLLLLRSTDDRDLIAPAHEAAKSIADEAKRAQALLDIIKEIDFLSQSQ